MSGKLKVLVNGKTVNYLNKLIKMEKEYFRTDMTIKEAMSNAIHSFHECYYSGIWEYIENRQEIPELEEMLVVNGDVVDMSEYFYFDEDAEILLDYFLKSLTKWLSSENANISYATLLEYIIKSDLYDNYHFCKNKPKTDELLKKELAEQEKYYLNQISYFTSKLQELRETESLL